MDSMGVGAVEIRHNYVPDHRQHRQEAKRQSATQRCARGFCFFCTTVAPGVALGYPGSFQVTPHCWGVPRGRDPVVVLRPRRGWDSPCP